MPIQSLTTPALVRQRPIGKYSTVYMVLYADAPEQVKEFYTRMSELGVATYRKVHDVKGPVAVYVYADDPDMISAAKILTANGFIVRYVKLTTKLDDKKPINPSVCERQRGETVIAFAVRLQHGV